MTNTNFKNDLEKAKIYERLIADRYRSKGWTVKHAPNKRFSAYDLQLSKDGISTTVEIKVDYMNCKTGNIAVEYCKADRKTKAGVTAGNMNDYILYLLPDKEEKEFSYFILKKKELFNIAKKHHKFEAPCPDKNGYCLIVPLDFIKDIKDIKPCEFEQLKNAA